MDIKNIVEKYNLTEVEESILIYMRDHPGKKLRIRELAEKTFVSAATIINLAKKMNLSGYSELLFYFEREKDEFERKQLHEIVELYGQQFYEILKKYQKKLIVVIGIGYSNNIANYIAEFFNLFGLRAVSNTHNEFFRQSNSGEIVIIFISNSGNTSELMHMAEKAYNNNIEYILFTGNKMARISKNANFTICTDTYSVFRYTDYKPQLFFGTILIDFEILMGDVLKRI